MTFEEINLLTVEGEFFSLLPRIIDIEQVPQGEPVYQLDLDEEKSFYDRVIMHSSLVKPEEALFDAELVEVKAELTVLEQARLDELARIKDLTDRFNAIPDVRGAISKTAHEIPNPAIELKRIVEENDNARLVELESASTVFEAEQVQVAAAKQANDLVESVVDTCLGFVKIVMKSNITRGLTTGQKDQQATDYSEVFESIKDWRPGKAKALIAALTPDGILVDQALKDDLLEFLTSKGI